MKSKLPIIARIVLGAMFLAFGLNGFFHWTDLPLITPRVGSFFSGTGLFFPFLKSFEVVCGALLVFGAFVPLALIILAPIMLNIIFFNIFLAREGLPLVAFMTVLEVYLAFFSKPYSPVVKQIFRNSSNE